MKLFRKLWRKDDPNDSHLGESKSNDNQRPITDSASSRNKQVLGRDEVVQALAVPYQYRSLQPRGDAQYQDAQSPTIRLFTFDVSTCKSGQILVNFHHAAVGKLPALDTYAAVSYVWGEADFTHKVLCDGGSSHLRVTERLFYILHALQTQFTNDKFWIDAICINQDDPAERSCQVQRMSQIYRRASRVHIFLGTPSLQPNHCFQSEWFSRRWVIQEFISAQEAVAHCDVLPPVRKSAAQRGYSLLRKPHTNNCPQEYHLPWDDVLKKMQDYITEKTHIQSLDQSKIRVIQELRAIQDLKTGRYGILSLLTIFHQSKCRDNRDRLFAFFGIANDLVSDGELVEQVQSSRAKTFNDISKAITSASIKCTIDYRLTVSEVYSRFALAVLQSAYPINLLHCAGAFRNRRQKKSAVSRVRGSCSWVPDWSLSPLYAPLLKATKFSAGFSSVYKRPLIKIQKETMTITVAGTQVGTVCETFQEYPNSIDRTVYVEYLQCEHIDLSEGRTGIAVSNSSQKKLVGCAPSDVKIGDVVVILAGARTPFILELSELGSFRLIGDCFLPEIMHGEALLSVTALEDFTLF